MVHFVHVMGQGTKLRVLLWPLCTPLASNVFGKSQEGSGSGQDIQCAITDPCIRSILLVQQGFGMAKQT